MNYSLFLYRQHWDLSTFPLPAPIPASRTLQAAPDHQGIISSLLPEMPAHEHLCTHFIMVSHAPPGPGQHVGGHTEGFLPCTPGLRCVSLKMYVWKYEFTIRYSLIMKGLRSSSLPVICLFDKPRGQEFVSCTWRKHSGE